MEQAASTQAFNYSPRIINWIATLGGLIYIAFCAIFYQERTLILDVAYQTFQMIHNHSLEIQVNRFGSGLVHVLPLLAIKLKLSLPTILMLYSLSFPLVYAMFFLLITRVFKQWDLGLALLLLYTLVTLDGFYWATSELQQGLGFLLVLMAALKRYFNARDLPFWLGMIPGMVTLVFYHPLLPLVFIWGWVYYWKLFPQMRNRRMVDMLLLAIVIVIIKSAWFSTGYDDMKFKGMLGALRDYGVFGWVKMPAHKAFLVFSAQVFYAFWALLAIVSWHYVRRRQYVLLGWMWASCIGWILLGNFGNPTFVFPFYQEVSYLPLALFAGVPFVKEVLPTWSMRLGYGVFAGILALRLLVIGLHHDIYSARLLWLDRQIADCAAQGVDRGWIPDEGLPMDTVRMGWGCTYETALRSSLQGPEHSKIVSIVVDEQAKAAELANPDLIVGDFINHQVSQLDSSYFKIRQGPTKQLR